MKQVHNDWDRDNLCTLYCQDMNFWWPVNRLCPSSCSSSTTGLSLFPLCCVSQSDSKHRRTSPTFHHQQQEALTLRCLLAGLTGRLKKEGTSNTRMNAQTYRTNLHTNILIYMADMSKMTTFSLDFSGRLKLVWAKQQQKTFSKRMLGNLFLFLLLRELSHLNN